MRVALLSMMEPAQAGNLAPRAFLRLGGVTVARHQLVLALAAGCERIVCLTRAMDPDLAELQHAAEQAGARVHLIAGSRALSGMVTAADEVLVITDGLLPARAEALRLIGGSPAVLVQPALQAVGAGFERIGPDLAAAGLMLLPGRLIERLNDLPADADPPSALLRIALQAGIAQRSLPDAVITAGHWLLVRDEDEAHAAEHGWMERHTAAPRRTPGLMLASLLVRRFGSALLHAGSSGTGMVLAAAALLALGFGAGWFGWSALAFSLCVPAWLLRRSAAILERINSDSLGQPPGLRGNEATFDWLLDGLIIVLLVMAIQPLPGASLMQRGFAPLVLVGLLRLLPRAYPGQWTVWLTDRTVILAVLAVLAAAQVLGAGILLISAALMVAGFVVPINPASPTDRDRLT